MARKLSAWEESGWCRGERIPGGNQGHTFLARQMSDPSGEFNFVLKELKRQDDPVRRRRFYVEAKSLKAADFPGVAKLGGTNADAFADPSVDLYVVTERVVGPDLTTFQDNPTDIATAVTILDSVLRTLGMCHEIGLRHRDIKPCHIILRNGRIEDPVLIDFGLAFNEELELDQSTGLVEGVGNRFLILWEQLHGDGKRDHRSDIAQCVGIFFYLLTGIVPGIAVDSNLKKPHEKIDLAGVLNNATDEQVRQIGKVFDVGFELDRERRWQSAEDLRLILLQLSQDQVTSKKEQFSQKLASVVSAAQQNPEIEWHRRGKALLSHVAEVCATRLKQIQQECQQIVTLRPVNNPNAGLKENEIRFDWKASNASFPSPPLTLIIQAKRQRNEVLMSAKSSSKIGAGTQIAEFMPQKRVGLLDPMAEVVTEEFIDECWIIFLQQAIASWAEMASVKS